MVILITVKTVIFYIITVKYYCNTIFFFVKEREREKVRSRTCPKSQNKKNLCLKNQHKPTYHINI